MLPGPVDFSSKELGQLYRNSGFSLEDVSVYKDKREKKVKDGET